MTLYQTLTLKLFGYNQTEALSLNSMLSLAERRLSRRWQVSDDDDATFCMLPERVALDPAPHAFPPERRIITVLSLDGNFGAGHRLAVDERNMPALADLVALLNHLADHPDGNTPLPTKETPSTKSKKKTSSAEAVAAVAETDSPGSNKKVKTTVAAAAEPEPDEPLPSVPPPAETSNASIGRTPSPECLAATETPWLDPRQGPLGLVLAALAMQSWLRIGLRAQTQTVLYICPSQQACYSPLPLAELQPLLAAPDTDLSVSFGAEPDTAELPHWLEKQGLQTLPLAHLIWCAGYWRSTGRPLFGADEQDIVRLQRWPDNSLPDSQNWLKMAAFMQGNSANLRQIAAALSIPMEQVQNFYNACKLAGWIRQEKQASAPRKKAMPKGTAALFAALKSHLEQNIADDKP